MNVLYVYQPGNPFTAGLERRLVERVNRETGHRIEFWDWGPEHGFAFNPSPAWTERQGGDLRAFHEALLRRCAGRDAVLIAQTGAVPPELMARLGPLTVYNTADDPESSATCSLPYLQAADLVAHAGVSWDAATRLGEALRARGARRTAFFPLGFYDEQFPALAEFDAVFARRDVPLVYVGHLKRGKLDPLMRRFPRMRVHSHSQKWKHRLYLLLMTRRVVQPYRGELADLYSRCQVGLNIHFGYGPSNTRCYQLCATGVAQVLDCPEGAAELYRPGEEVLVYQGLEQAVDRIETLLADEQARYRLSRAGYEAARARFNRFDTFCALLDHLT